MISSTLGGATFITFSSLDFSILGSLVVSGDFSFFSSLLSTKEKSEDSYLSSSFLLLVGGINTNKK